MDAQESTLLTISIQIERMTGDLFAFWLKRDWSDIKDGIHTLDLNINATSASYEYGTLVYWSEDNPTRFKRLMSISWVQLRTDEIIVSFDGVGKESDLSFESFDPLSRQLLGWLKRRFGIDIATKAKIKPAVSSKRKKDRPMRIKAGLVRWRASQIGKAVDTVCDDNTIMPAATYYNYQREDLVYTDDDIAELHTTWPDLWGAYNRGKLEAHIKELLENS